MNEAETRAELIDHGYSLKLSEKTTLFAVAPVRGAAGFGVVFICGPCLDHAR